MSRSKSKSSFRYAALFFKEYFIESEDRTKAWLFLIAAIVCAVGIVGLFALLNGWALGFWAALSAKELIPFLFCIAEFSLIISSIVGLNVLKKYCLDKLALRWQVWLTHKITDELFDSENNYLDLKRFSSQVPNVDQRIESVGDFVRLTLSLGVDFIQNSLALVVFSASLWVVGGSLSFILLGLNIVIPGYLFWLSLLIAVAATAITHYLGRSLKDNNKQEQQAAASLRQNIAEVMENAEHIAEEHSEHFYRAASHETIDKIEDIGNKRVDIEVKLTAFENFYLQLSQILPYLLAAPLYFKSVIDLNQLMQVGNSFNQVYQSFSWFITTYKDRADLTAHLERVVELRESFLPGGLDSNPKNIVRREHDDDSILIEDLHVQLPQRQDSNQFMLTKLNLQLKRGQHTLIQGVSGFGKSTVFRGISATWPYGHGQILIPKGQSIYFIPQKPYFPRCSLRALLAFPDHEETYDDDQYIDVLRSVGAEKFIHRLDEVSEWSKILSGGEPQRFTFARAFLRKPDWLFLDESTSAVDEPSEELLYTLATELPDTTIVSIAHRSTVKKFHQRTVFFSLGADSEVIVEERPCTIEPR